MAQHAEVKERLLMKIDDSRDDIISFLQSLVRIPSVTGHEKEYQLYMARTLGNMGFKVDMWETDEEELRTSTKITLQIVSARLL